MADTHSVEHMQQMMRNYSPDELTKVRDWVDERLISFQDDTLGSADASADDEKKKYIAQHGSNPIAQTSAQNVPQPVSDEVKDLQNEKAEEEHQAKGTQAYLNQERENQAKYDKSAQEHADSVSAKERDKLAAK